LFDGIGRDDVIAAFLQDTGDARLAATEFKRETVIVSDDDNPRLGLCPEGVLSRAQAIHSSVNCDQ
jgi:hypothetical protein